MPEALIQKVDCIRLCVDDIETGLIFYRDRLGLSLVWRTKDQVGLKMGQSDTELVLHTERQNSEINLKVESAVEAAEKFHASGGRIIVPPFDVQIGKAAVVQDPWENTYVLIDSTKGLLATDEKGNVIGNR
jgi:predicted enzyme related to lactoylglutathione lyase